jgi:hypothetical protein
MSALTIFGVSDRQLIEAGWLLFSLGYLTKYVLDRRFAFGIGKHNFIDQTD